MTRRPVTFRVTFDLPAGATIGDCVAYVESALQAECGQTHPDDPMHAFNRKSIRVRWLGTEMAD